MKKENIPAYIINTCLVILTLLMIYRYFNGMSPFLTRSSFEGKETLGISGSNFEPEAPPPIPFWNNS